MLAPAPPPPHTVLDGLVQAMLRFCAAVNTYVLAESYCPLSGVPAMVNHALAVLTQRVRSGYAPLTVACIFRIMDGRWAKD